MSHFDTLSMERKRVDYVSRAVLEWKEKAWGREAGQRTKGLPVELRAQGLMVTVAKLLQRGKEVEKLLADLLARWILYETPLPILQVPGVPKRPAQDLLIACNNAQRSAYRDAQAEALALLELVKLFAGALFGEKPEEDEKISLAPITTSADASESMQQARHAFAFEHVLHWKQNVQSTATARVKGLPVEVTTQGLLVALANLMRADRPGHLALANLLAAWLLVEAPRKILDGADGAAAEPVDLLSACARVGRTEYAAAQAEALALLHSVKIYAEAFYSTSEEELDHAK